MSKTTSTTIPTAASIQDVKQGRTKTVILVCDMNYELDSSFYSLVQLHHIHHSDKHELSEKWENIKRKDCRNDSTVN